MAWIELSLDTTDEAVDWVRTLLARTSYASDVRVTTYVAPDPALPSEGSTAPTWAFTICFYLPYDRQSQARVEEIEQLLSSLQRSGLTTALEAVVVEEKPTEATLNALVQRIGQHFVVLPADATDTVLQEKDVTLRLPSSLAFGSGFHPATIVCLRLLERHLLPRMDTLDLGCGSGILSVAMAKLGASVLALDNDSTAIRATQEAVQLNGVEQQVTVLEASLGQGSELGHWMGGTTLATVPNIDAQERFDLIVANILARVHITLAPDFQRALRRSPTQAGRLIIAGFTVDYEADVTAALAQAGFELIDREPLNEWPALAFRLV